MSNFVIAQGIIVLVGVLIYSLFFRKKRDGLLPLPPGPKPVPILGNVRDGPPDGMPPFLHWLTFKDKHGPISSITVLGQTVVFLHDKEAAVELLEKKTAMKTSGRPTFIFSQMCGYGKQMTMLQYDDELRLYRKLVHQQFGTKLLASQHAHVQDVEVKRFLLRVLNEPGNLFSHIRAEAAAVILKITYGYSVELYKPDPLVKLIEDVTLETSEALVPVRWAVDIFPALQHLPEWLPGAGFKRLARRYKANADAAAEAPLSFVKQQMAMGAHQESYCSRLIETYKNGDKEPDQVIAEAIKWTSAVLFSGGADTTVSAIMAFVLAMILHPEVQQKAQEELDRVVGPCRLPGKEDQDNLPYINAIVKEALRYYPVAPLAAPHRVSEEIVYKGYRIPKDTYIMPTTWWYLHDPKVYPEPEKFVPERFLEPRNEPDPDAAFGHGRRVCPGRYVAQESLYLTISQTLAAFNIGKAMKEGKPVEVECKHTLGIVDRPEEFQYSIVPRSEKHAEMIRRVEVDHPWEGSSTDGIQGNPVFDKFKAACEAES